MRTLVVTWLRGGSAPTEYVVAEGESVVFGRSAPPAAIALDHPFLARRAFSVELPIGGAAVVRDLESSGGLFDAEGRRFEMRAFADGDEFYLNPVVLRFRLSFRPRP